MDRLIAVISLALTLLISTNVTAKTILVYPGNETLQAAIDNASSGDVLVLRAGNYHAGQSEQISVHKSLTLIPENLSQKPAITVPILLGGANCSINVTLQQLTITRGIYTSSSVCGGQANLIELTVTDSDITAGGNFNNWIIVGNRLTNAKIYANSNGSRNLVYIAANTIKAGSIVVSNGYEDSYIVGNKITPSDDQSERFAYYIRSTSYKNNYIIGNYIEAGINRTDGDVLAVHINGNYQSDYDKLVTNNVIKFVPQGNDIGAWTSAKEIIGVKGSGGYQYINNNIIVFPDDLPELDEESSAIYLGSSGAAYNNIIENFPGAAVYDQSNDMYEVNYNLCYQNGTNCGDDRDNLNVAPLYNETDYTPLSGSPLIDGGFELVQYNDLDGTRNDIGVHGGPYGYAQYQAQLEDSDKPYVFPIFGVTQPDEPNSVAVSVLAVARMK